MGWDIVDTNTLINLAKAGELLSPSNPSQYLNNFLSNATASGEKIVITDMVLAESTRNASASDAAVIQSWYTQNQNSIVTQSTGTFSAFNNGQLGSADAGDRSIVEAATNLVGGGVAPSDITVYSDDPIFVTGSYAQLPGPGATGAAAEFPKGNPALLNVSAETTQGLLADQVVSGGLSQATAQNIVNTLTRKAGTR